MKNKILIILCTLAAIFIVRCYNENDKKNNEEAIKLNLNKCIKKGSPEKLEIVTWNIEHFPKRTSTISNVASVIKEMNVDIVALQEIAEKKYLRKVAELLPNWEFVIHEQSGLNLAYLYNKNTVSVIGKPYAILKQDRYELPRSPFVLPIHFKKYKMDILLVNNHLKAMDGKENETRRRKASILLKTWADKKHSDENIVILGDLNDEITDSPSQNVFQAFIDDQKNYSFADMKIAKMQKKKWSYPSFPSHIDHILISDELFDNLEDVYTYTFNECDRRYKTVISDHYPVCIVLGKDLK